MNLVSSFAGVMARAGVVDARTSADMISIGRDEEKKETVLSTILQFRSISHNPKLLSANGALGLAYCTECRQYVPIVAGS